ncbi:MAG: translation initiation factor IF-2, partial [SAR116 cluster bacterium]|nr:translation initiation factor IF-2 [SAR116 cluster bacterium]
MSDDSGKSKKLSLSGSKLTLGGVDAGQMRAGATGGARRTVQVEVRRKRAPAAPHRVPATPVAEPAAPAPQPAPAQPAPAEADDKLTAQERAARVRALQEGLRKPDAPAPDSPAADGVSSAEDAPATAETPAADAATPADTAPVEAPVAAPLDPVSARREAELAELREIEAAEERRREDEARKHSEATARRATADTAAPAARAPGDAASEPFNRRRRQVDDTPSRRPAPARRDGPGRRQSGKMTITQALSGDEQRRQRSLASVRRQREKAR